MKKFIKSEKYRKYLIGIDFNEVSLFTVWGTDMADEETDKLLVKDDKLIAFKTLDDLTENFKRLDHPFKDHGNFEKWISEEQFQHVYTYYDMAVLENLNVSTLNDKDDSLAILDCLNLIQDFSIQVNNHGLNALFEVSEMEVLKDFIYGNYFWTKIEEHIISESDIPKLSSLVKKTLDVFRAEIEIV